MGIKLARMTTAPLSLRVLLKGQEIYFSKNKFTMHLASGPGDRVTESGMNIELLPLSREFSIWQDIYALWKTWRWLRTIRPDILHTHTPKAGLIGILAGYVAGVPIRLHTVAGLPEMELKGLKKLILRWTEKLTSLFATRIYPNSNGLMKYMEQEGLASRRKMKVIGNGSSNGIDIEYFKPSPFLHREARHIRKIYRIAETELVFVFIGRLDNHKGIRELQVAFEQVRDKHEKMWLLLVGPIETVRGGLDPDTHKWFRSNDFVIMPGFQNDVRPWLLAGDVLVFPSYREGFPNVLLQAAAMGLPVVATDIIGCNEIVSHEINGLLIPKKDPNALASAMLYFLHNKQKRQEMGKCGREMVVAGYEQRWFWRELKTEYQSLLKTLYKKNASKSIYPSSQTSI